MSDKNNSVEVLLDAVNNATAELRVVQQDLAKLDAANKVAVTSSDAATAAANRQKAALAASAAQLKTVGVAAQAANRSMAAIRGTMMLVGGTVAPQFTGAMLVAAQSLEQVRSLSAATGLGLSAMGGLTAGAAIHAWTLYEAYRALAAQLEELRTSKALDDQSKTLKDKLIPQLERAVELGRIQMTEGIGAINRLRGGGSQDQQRDAIQAAQSLLRGANAVDTTRAAELVVEDFLKGINLQLLTGAEKERATISASLDKLLQEGIELSNKAGSDPQPIIDAVNRVRDVQFKELARVEAEKRAAETKAFQERLDKSVEQELQLHQRINQVRDGLAMQLADAHARAGADPVFGADPETVARADIAAELLAHNMRLQMIQELGMKEAEARQFRETAELIHSQRLIEIDRQTADAKKQIELNRADALAASLGQIAETAKMYGEEGFKVFKAFAIAQATISTYSSAIKSFDAVAMIPYVGPVLAPIAAAAAVAAGVANISRIVAATPGYSTGGIIPGNYNGRDDRLIKVGPGEVVLTPRQASRVGMEAIYTALAETGGKIPGRTSPSASVSIPHFNTGGIVPSAAGGVTNFNVGLISNRQDEREFQLRQGTRMVLRELEQRKVRS